MQMMHPDPEGLGGILGAGGGEQSALDDLNARLASADFSAAAMASVPVARVASDPSTWGKVGRNEACPCGSCKKYKHCHGALV